MTLFGEEQLTFDDDFREINGSRWRKVKCHKCKGTARKGLSSCEECIDGYRWRYAGRAGA